MSTSKSPPFRTVLRLPRSLATAIKGQARRDGVSLNTFIVQRLTAEVKLDEAAAELVEVIDEHLATLSADHRDLAHRNLLRALRGKEPHQC